MNIINGIKSQIYGYTPDAVKEKALESERFRDSHDFYRLVKIKHQAERYKHADVKKMT